MCFKPLDVFQAPDGGPISFVERKGMVSITIPCGRCIDCRMARARDWAIRCMHESLLHQRSMFATMTYDDEHYPEDGCVSVRACQLFMKRLRARFAPERVRFFMSAEYGPTTWRAHYHALLYGLWPEDAKRWSGRGENELFSSAIVDDCWRQGRVLFGRVTFESAQYCAGYVVEKVTGDLAESHYLRPHPVSGELVQLTPPFAVMSRKPGIGHGFLERYGSDVYPRGEVVMRGGVRMPPPRYYDKWFAERDPQGAEDLAIVRELRAYERRGDNTVRRLADKEQVALGQRRRAFEQRRGVL